MKKKSQRGSTYLTEIHMTIRRFAVAVHPQGQNQGQGQDTQRQQGVHEHVEQRGHSGRRTDFYCQETTRYPLLC